MIQNNYFLIFLLSIIIISSVSVFLFKKYYKPYVKKKYYNLGLEIITEMRKNTKIKDRGFKEINKYYINLDRCTDRREKIEQEFKIYNANIKWTWHQEICQERVKQ